MFANPLNIIVFVVFFMVIAVVGYLSGREEKNIDDFFLGKRKIPWFAVCLSILATECSSITVIGVPAIAFAKGGNYGYIQLAIGSLIGRILIATIFLIPFYNTKVTTVYEYLKVRFGPKSQILGAIFFFVTRLLGTGVRLYTVALALHVVFGIPIAITILISAGITTAYTLWGGIKAVIWTDVVQFSVFMCGAILCVGYIYNSCGGYEPIYKIASEAGKWKFFDLSIDFKNEFTLLNGIIFGCFMTFAALGTDQDLTQRMLTCKESKLAQKALILTGIIDFPLVLTFLTIGVLLYVFYQINPDTAIPLQNDQIFPHFILNVLPPGISGLMIVAIFSADMSSLDSALNALSSSAICDVYKPFLAKGKTEKHYLLVSRIMIVVFAIILIAIAYMSKNIQSVLILAFKVSSYTYGGLLGIFLIGTLTKKGTERGNIIAMLTSVLVVFIVSKTPLTWSWFIVIGTLWTFFLGITYPYIEITVKKVFSNKISSKSIA